MDKCETLGNLTENIAKNYIEREREAVYNLLCENGIKPKSHSEKDLIKAMDELEEQGKMIKKQEISQPVKFEEKASDGMVFSQVFYSTYSVVEDCIFYNYKPVWENMHTVWEPDYCKCGSNKIIKIDECTYKCYGCGKFIEKSR